MSERIFIGVAWPYANGPLHLGHIAGCYLPADIFARFHRTLGNQVLMVSGSDQHGTPVTLRADQEGKSPQEVVDRYHAQFVESWKKLGISFDRYTTTGTDNHRQVAQDFFSGFLQNGLLYESSGLLPYCPRDRRYLPDRYIVGTCPNCSFPKARGDQCDNCGRTLDPVDLVNAQCSLCGATPEFRQRPHYMFKLSHFENDLRDWLTATQAKDGHWRPNVYNTSLGLLKDLPDRAITRDLQWGVPVPVEGWEDRRIYVWFEAVIGYLSASMEWAQRTGDSDAWKAWWGPEAKPYYFIGKDNIPFHTIIWPAMLMARGGLALPYDVPANEFLNLEGGKFSTSRNWAVWIPDYLASYAPDPLRYVLAATMPETSDSEFTWRDYVRRNNNELVGTYGNLVNRVLTFLQRPPFEGVVPQASPDERSQRLLDQAEKALEEAKAHLTACHFRAALGVAMGLAQEGNRYLDERAPWRTIKDNMDETARTLATTLTVIATLKTLFYPFLPHSSQRLHELLGFSGDVQATGWRTVAPAPGTRLQAPTIIFEKLDEKEVVARETAKLGQGTAV